MRNIFRFFLSLVTAIVLFGCSDRLDDYYTAEDLAGLKVHLQLPDYSRALVKTRAEDGNDEKISSVTVIAYDSKNNFISQQTLTPGTDRSITPSLPSGTATVAVVTNTKLTDAQCANLSSTFLVTTPSPTAPVCWGSASVNELLKSTPPTISLLRMTAKVTVQTDPSVKDFTVEGIKMYKTANSGSIAPDAAALTKGVVTNASDVTFGDISTDFAASQVFYETPAKKAFLIVKGKYKDTEGKDNVGYYKVQMYKDAEKSNEEFDLLRNHNYIVTIKSVNEAGYSKEADAVAGDAENRMKVTVVDDNPPIVDMISCKDYELGVCAPLTMDGNGGTIKATVVTSFKNSSNTYDYKITGAPDWVKVEAAKRIKLPTTSADGGKQGALDDIPITVAKNTTDHERTATLTVTAGDLTRTITITQAGYDFLSDPGRKVTFLIDDKPQSVDYFRDFLPAVNGVSAAANQGLARDHGLHFAAVMGNTYSYKIPHLTGDKLENNDTRIAITDEGEGKDYIVTLKKNDDEDLWVSLSAFKITNAQKVTITYPVYHTGVLHYIKPDIADAWELGPQKTGWFYYGVVEVKKEGGNTYRLLDRNIGATNNGFYSPATQATVANSGATGAYLILTKEKLTKDKTEGDIGKDYIPFPDYFHIPEGDANGPTDGVDEITDLPVTISTKTTADGETYYCYVITTTGGEDSKVQPKEVYLPVTGYYEGTAFRNDNHANIWSRSRLSAYQGFSADSPEYGLWFLYLDFNGSKQTVSNMRVVNGSAGRIGIGDGGKDAIYKAMPVRGIHKK